MRPVLLADRVRCVGDRVAFVVAETEAQARDAAELVEVDYEPLPAVVDRGRRSRAGRAPRSGEDCPNGNVAVTIAFGDKAATDAAFAKAKHVVSLRLENNRITANAIEPRCALGSYSAANDRYTLYTTSQDPHGVRSKLASGVLRYAGNQNPRDSPDVGGGFGMKSNVYPDDVLVLWASRRVGRPVKWTATRGESLCSTRMRAIRSSMARWRSTRRAKYSAVRARAYQALGAYWWAAITAPLFFSLMLIPSVYDMQAVDLRTRRSSPTPRRRRSIVAPAGRRRSI